MMAQWAIFAVDGVNKTRKIEFRTTQPHAAVSR